MYDSLYFLHLVSLLFSLHTLCWRLLLCAVELNEIFKVNYFLCADGEWFCVVFPFVSTACEGWRYFLITFWHFWRLLSSSVVKYHFECSYMFIKSADLYRALLTTFITLLMNIKGSFLKLNLFLFCSFAGRWIRRDWSSPPDARNVDATRRLYSSVFLGSPGKFNISIPLRLINWTQHLMLNRVRCLNRDRQNSKQIYIGFA